MQTLSNKMVNLYVLWGIHMIGYVGDSYDRICLRSNVNKILQEYVTLSQL